MAAEHSPLLEVGPPDVLDDPPRTTIPPAFYRDDDPPEPPDDDPHWQEFPFFDAMKGSRLIVVCIVAGVIFVTLVHMMVILTL